MPNDHNLAQDWRNAYLNERHYRQQCDSHVTYLNSNINGLLSNLNFCNRDLEECLRNPNTNSEPDTSDTTTTARTTPSSTSIESTTSSEKCMNIFLCSILGFRKIYIF